jgi:hypothetical protein
VIAKKAASNVSQEPETKELKEVFNQITDTEKARTVNRMKPSSYFIREPKPWEGRHHVACFHTITNAVIIPGTVGRIVRIAAMRAPVYCPPQVA